jgi:hypothetical protein
MNALRIKRVAAARGRRLEVEWSNGERHVVDLSTAVADSRGLRRLATPAAFRTARVGEYGHSVSWAGDIAIGADTLRRLALEQTGDFTDPGDFAAWRASLGLSLAQAARALGLSRRMIAYYDSGARPVPRVVALACRGYLAVARAA